MLPDADSIPVPSQGVISSIKSFAASFASHLRTRLQLFATEFAEEKIRLTSLLFGVLSAFFSFFVAIILAIFFVIVAVWDTPYRLYAIGGLMLFFLIGAFIFWSIVRYKLKSRPHLFQASLAEFYKDQQQLGS